MRVRSWMAALALTAAAIPIGRGLTAWGQGTTQSSAPATASGKKSATDAGKTRHATPKNSATAKTPAGSRSPIIELTLAIAGLGAQGCDVEVKPANAGCRFRPLPSTHVPPTGQVTVSLCDIELRGADKMCTVAITVHEPGQPARTIYRGYRLGSVKPGAVHKYQCYFGAAMAGTGARTIRK